jgi:hypothetical protein
MINNIVLKYNLLAFSRRSKKKNTGLDMSVSDRRASPSDTIHPSFSHSFNVLFKEKSTVTEKEWEEGEIRK